MSPLVLVAFSAPLTVAVPRLSSPLAVAFNVPFTVSVPKSSAPPLLATVTLPAVLTVPSVRPPLPSTIVALRACVTLTGPVKLLLDPPNVISAGAPEAVAESVVVPVA